MGGGSRLVLWLQALKIFNSGHRPKLSHFLICSLQCGHISAPAALGTLWEGLAAPLLELGAGPGPGLRWVCAALFRTLQITFGRAGGGGMAAGVGGPTVFISFHAFILAGMGVFWVYHFQGFCFGCRCGGKACAACYTYVMWCARAYFLLVCGQ